MFHRQTDQVHSDFLFNGLAYYVCHVALTLAHVGACVVRIIPRVIGISSERLPTHVGL
ncbi:hypothetical protein D3C78_1787000 [compost metagenome]